MEPNLTDLTLPEEDRQELIGWTVACVERLLPVFAADRPEYSRLRDALDGARQFTAGQLSVDQTRKFAFGCHTAAREASSVTATAVARTCGQAVAVAHMAGHSREIARYTRKALTGEKLAQELEWRRTHVPPGSVSTSTTTAPEQRPHQESMGPRTRCPSADPSATSPPASPSHMCFAAANSAIGTAGVGLALPSARYAA